MLVPYLAASIISGGIGRSIVARSGISTAENALGFIGLCINNLLLMIDKVFVTDRVFLDPAWRSGVALVGLSILIYGLVWNAES